MAFRISVCWNLISKKRNRVVLLWAGIDLPCLTSVWRDASASPLDVTSLLAEDLILLEFFQLKTGIFLAEFYFVVTLFYYRC